MTTKKFLLVLILKSRTHKDDFVVVTTRHWQSASGRYRKEFALDL